MNDEPLFSPSETVQAIRELIAEHGGPDGDIESVTAGGRCSMCGVEFEVPFEELDTLEGRLTAHVEVCPGMEDEDDE